MTVFDFIDKYKYGLIAATSAYVAMFMYFQLGSYEETITIVPFNDGAFIENAQEKIELEPENVEVSPELTGEIKNMTSDANDSRRVDNQNYFENKSQDQIAAEIKALEQQIKDQSGGAKKRAQIQQMINDRKAYQEQQQNQQNHNNNTPSPGGDTRTNARTLASFDLPGRNPFQNNGWYIRKPGYTCQQGTSGTVVVSIRVDVGGKVTFAEVVSVSGAGDKGCMKANALKYAKMSRFDYKGDAPKSQSGTITYTYVPG